MSPEITSTPTPNLVTSLRFMAENQNIFIGAAISDRALKNDKEYAEILAKEFNIMTAENVMKFGPIHPEPGHYDFTNADLLVAFAEEHNMKMRGHTLVWHQQLPDWFTDPNRTLCNDLNAILKDHITTVVSRYRGRIESWDVVNEAIDDKLGKYRESLFYACIGKDYIEKAFRWAHEADPEAKLIYNDYNIEFPGDKAEAVYALVRSLIENGVPIHGVGFQMHLQNNVNVPFLTESMQRYADLGLEVQITELDVRLPNPISVSAYEFQAGVYGDIMRTCLKAENCTTFVMWGFTDKYSWIPSFFKGFDDALIFDRQFQPKPAYWALVDELSQ
jgi:endo-1,4-beta-xylanase